MSMWDIVFIVGIGLLLALLGLAYIGAEPIPRFDDEVTDYAPETPTLPPAMVTPEALAERIAKSRGLAAKRKAWALQQEIDDMTAPARRDRHHG